MTRWPQLAALNADKNWRPTVVVVDDDVQVLKSIQVVLQREFKVHAATTAQDGVEVVRSTSPDVIVLDVKMPDHDGFWVFNEIRKFNSRVPVIFNSAYHDAVSAEKQRHEPYGMLPKGANVKEFMTMIVDAAVWSYKNNKT